jgi:hypothetical protein
MGKCPISAYGPVMGKCLKKFGRGVWETYVKYSRLLLGKCLKSSYRPVSDKCLKVLHPMYVLKML